MPPTQTFTANPWAARACTATMKQPKNPANLAAMERLQKIRESAQSNNTHYAFTVTKAMNSLANCPDAIVSRKQALELKYVGAHTARVIVPNDMATTAALSRSSSVASSTSKETAENNNSSKPRKRMKQTTLASQESSISTSDTKSLNSKPQKSAKQIAYDKAVKESETMVLDPSGWTVVLLLDKREQPRDHVQAKLQMSGVPCEQRSLPIGDMAWIAKSKQNQQEVMLGTICERKTASDLRSSLFGTRYLEQRLRLQNCGLQQILLLVEGDVGAVQNCPGDTLRMAMMETRVHLNFQIVQTRHLDDTVRFLKRVHRRILERTFPSAFGELSTTSVPSFRSPNATPRARRKKKESLNEMVMDTPPLPPRGTQRFISYKELKARVERDRELGTRTVGAIQMAMLKQIASFSHKKVQAISQAYPTPSALMRAFDGLSEEDGKTLVKDLSTNSSAERACRIGPKSAEELYYVCTKGGSGAVQGDLIVPVKDQVEETTNSPEEKKKPARKKATKKRTVAELESSNDDCKKPAARGSLKHDSLQDLNSLERKAARQAATGVARLPWKWSCPSCTMDNPSYFDLCDACGSTRPLETVSTTTTAMPNSTYDVSDLLVSDDDDSPKFNRAASRDRHVVATPNALNTSTWSAACSPPGIDWANITSSTPSFAPSIAETRNSSSGGKNAQFVDMSVDDDDSPNALNTRTWSAGNSPPGIDWANDTSSTPSFAPSSAETRNSSSRVKKAQFVDMSVDDDDSVGFDLAKNSRTPVSSGNAAKEKKAQFVDMSLDDDDSDCQAMNMSDDSDGILASSHPTGLAEKPKACRPMDFSPNVSSLERRVLSERQHETENKTPAASRRDAFSPQSEPPTPGFVTLHKAPWDESSSSDESSVAEEEQSLMVRFRKRQKRAQQDKKRSVSIATDDASGAAVDKSPSLIDSTCRLDSSAASGKRPRQATPPAVEVIEID